LNREIVQFLGRPEAREKFLTAGVEPVGSTPDQFAATIQSEMAKWGKLMKDVGIRAE
jgi:tripartite-type tricarboxylate transporter receptor subunit TctC